VYRIREKSGFGVGVQHVVEVLCGADTEKVRKFGHQSLSTYGIGTEHHRSDWGNIGRQLVRLGFLVQNAEKFNILELTEAGRTALKSRQKITLTKPVSAPAAPTHQVGEIACDEELFETLRQLRKRLADERGVPPYIVFSDVALRQMARFYPKSDREFSRISGVGDKKLREFGVVFLREIAEHLRTHPRQMFADNSFGEPSPAQRSKLTDTVRESLHFFEEGHEVAAIARIRKLSEGTIYAHLADAILGGEGLALDRLVGPKARQEIATALTGYRAASLSPVFDKLGGRHPYGHIRICRAMIQAGRGAEL
jgi:ATP-dependent DNA helicase RecQ